ncbi:MAG TPA: hypothetical protein VMS92_22990 [Mycobacterium sp.]|nr:hypothetical protein [Mycobacterium sp.]
MIAFVGARCMAAHRGTCSACGRWVRVAVIQTRVEDSAPWVRLELCSGCCRQAWDAAKKARK